MNERELRELLRSGGVPEEREAEARAWALTQRAYANQREAPRRRRASRPLLVAAATAVLALTILSPAGAAIRHWVSDVVAPGSENARPALRSLPAPGKLLVNSPRGPWVVQANGEQRLLGDYQRAAWSPHGVYAVATRGTQLVALETNGDPRWALTSARPVSMPSWQAPDGFRIAYLSGRSLHVVAGDGTSDRVIAGAVAPVTPAWRPGARHVLAFVDTHGTVRVENTDSSRFLSRPTLFEARDLAWSRNGMELAGAIGSQIAVVRPLASNPQTRITPPDPGSDVQQPAFSPRGGQLAFVRNSSGGERPTSELVTAGLGAGRIAERTILSVPGRLIDPTWSPDGRWLLVGWGEANQWLFIDTHDPSKVIAINNINRQFDPGSTGTGAFPRISGWCCAP